MVTDSSAPAVDKAQLAELQMIMEDDFDELMKTYLSDGQKQINEIASAAARQDAEALRKAAHTFKGSSANISAQILSQLCAGLEADAKKGDLAGVDTHLSQIKTEFERVKQAINTL